MENLKRIEIDFRNLNELTLNEDDEFDDDVGKEGFYIDLF